MDSVSINARTALLKNVSTTITLIALVSLAINTIVALTARQLPFAVYIRQPSFFGVLLTAILFYASRFFRFPVSGTVQAAAIFANGVFILSRTRPGDLSGAVFIVYSMILCLKFGFFGKRKAAVAITVIGAFFIAAATISSMQFIGTPLAALNTIAITALMLYLFWIPFADEIREYRVTNKTLTSMVAERTAELKKTNDALAEEVELQKRTQEELRESVAEKDVLLREVHHRVKNNLTVINGLLNLQMAKATDPALRSELLATRSRIFAMAFVHDSLYANDNLARVPMSRYVGELVHHIREMHESQVVIDVTFDEFDLGIDRAIPCSIVITECVTNALKHAFAPGDEGRVTVTGRHIGDALEITVSDNGRGMDSEAVESRDDNLGVVLIRSLAEQQLRATVELETTEGVTWRFVVPETPSLS